MSQWFICSNMQPIDPPEHFIRTVGVAYANGPTREQLRPVYYWRIEDMAALFDWLHANVPKADWDEVMELQEGDGLDIKGSFLKQQGFAFRKIEDAAMMRLSFQ